MSALVTVEAQRIVHLQPELAREVARLVNAGGNGAGLTKRQRELLLFIRGYIGEYGYSPSFEEMREGLGFSSKSSVHRLMQLLKERGFVEDRYQQSRSVTLRRIG